WHSRPRGADPVDHRDNTDGEVEAVATNLIDAIAKKKPNDFEHRRDPLGMITTARLDARSECSIRGFQTRLNALARSRHAIAKLSSASRRVASAIAAVRIYSSA